MWTRSDIAGLYERHGFAVFRRCRRLLRDEAEARDAVQEVFLKALENPGLFRAAASPATFLYAVATNVCLNQIRNRAARDANWAEAVARDLVEAQPALGPEGELAGRQLWELLLRETDQVMRAIVLYHFIDGLSQGEIAGLVGVSRVTVNQRLQKWRAQAQAALAEVGP